MNSSAKNSSLSYHEINEIQECVIPWKQVKFKFKQMNVNSPLHKLSTGHNQRFSDSSSTNNMQKHSNAKISLSTFIFECYHLIPSVSTLRQNQIFIFCNILNTSPIPSPTCNKSLSHYMNSFQS